MGGELGMAEEPEEVQDGQTPEKEGDGGGR